MHKEKRNKHIYSTYTLVGFIIIITLTIFVSALGSSDLDEICNSNNAILKRISGNWDCSTTHYGEIYFHNQTNPQIISIPFLSTYYNITGMSQSNMKGMTTDGEGFTINKTSVYDVTFHTSFSGGNSGNYELELYVNNVNQEDCSFHRTTTSTSIGDANLHCLKSLTAGDYVNMKIEDNGNPAQDTSMYIMNFKLVEVQ